MSLHYLLDGCNIASQLPLPEKESQQDERLLLLRLITLSRPQGSPNNQLTAVFDGHSKAISQMTFEGMSVVFSGDISADDKIREMIESSNHKRNFVVVSDDKAVQFAARQLGSRVMPAFEFVAKLKIPSDLKRITKMRSKEGKSKDISNVLEHKITAEFEGIWLRPKDKGNKTV